MRSIFTVSTILLIVSCQTEPKKEHSKTPLAVETHDFQQLTFSGENSYPFAHDGTLYFVKSIQGKADLYRMDKKHTQRVTFQNSTLAYPQVLNRKLYYASTYHSATQFPPPIFPNSLASSLPTVLRRWDIIMSDQYGKKPETIALKSTWATQIQISPNMQSVAFSTLDKNWHSIVIQDLKTSKTQKIQQPETHNVFPTWSSTGDLFWIKQSQSASQIFAKNTQKPLITLPGIIKDLVWNEHWGLVFSYRSDQYFQIYSLKENCLKQLTTESFNLSQPSISSTHSLYFVKNQQVFRKDLTDQEYNCMKRSGS